MRRSMAIRLRKIWIFPRLMMGWRHGFYRHGGSERNNWRRLDKNARYYRVKASLARLNMPKQREL